MIPDDIRQYVKKVNSGTWEIYSHEDISLKPKEVKFLMLGIGFMMSEGVVLTSLANSLSKKRCSIQNEVNLEDTINIIAVITNNLILRKLLKSKKTIFYFSFVIKNYDSI